MGPYFFRCTWQGGGEMGGRAVVSVHSLKRFQPTHWTMYTCKRCSGSVENLLERIWSIISNDLHWKSVNFPLTELGCLKHSQKVGYSDVQVQWARLWLQIVHFPPFLSVLFYRHSSTVASSVPWGYLYSPQFLDHIYLFWCITECSNSPYDKISICWECWCTNIITLWLLLKEYNNQ